MKRRAFVWSVLAGGAAAPAFASQMHQHQPITGSLASGTVSFGQWKTLGLDRFPNVSPIAPNGHQLIPQETRIRAGGSINFIIGGFHHVLIYAPGTTPESIDVNQTIPPTNGGPPLINYSINRIYRGLDPSLQPQDRVEVVSFADPGRYLVICGVRPHFVTDGMFGFIEVVA